MKNLYQKLILPLLLVVSLVFGIFPTNSAYAIEDDNNPDEFVSNELPDDVREADDGETSSDDPDGNLSIDAEIEDGTDRGEAVVDASSHAGGDNACKQQTGSLQWIICPVVNVAGKASDYLYNALQDILEVDPISMQSDQPVYVVWQYARDLTNIVFVGLILVAIYSQFTGLGISNYGIKRALPRLIIAAIMVNLSFIICSIALDLSNIVGSSLQEVFNDFIIKLNDSARGISMADFSWSGLATTLTTGVLTFGGGIAAVGGIQSLFWLIVVALFGVGISLLAGLITIGLRQGVVAILIMLAPLAITAYILPNTEKLFRKWRELGTRMLVFYPLFSLLYGASKLIGWALIISATGPFGILTGMVIMVAPLFLSIQLMKMSGTVLGTVYNALTRAFTPVGRMGEAWARSHAEQNKQNYIANNMMPGSRLRNYLAYRQALRERNTADAKTVAEGRAQERALTYSSSYIGLDEHGNATWQSRANRYTRMAKRASLAKTRVDTAESALKNTLSAYGDHFGQGNRLANRAAARLSTAHAEAFEGAMIQEFLTANEAQNDQEYLLDRYLNAARGRYTNPYEFNRLIKNAAGSLRHNGESSIMGQVIQKSVEIENRRRREALTVMTKFGVDKPTSRAMIFNVAAIDDDGFEVDPVTGKKVEDIHHNIIGQHREWDKFIGVHKKTHKEITAEEYGKLTKKERQEYDRVRYFDITDDTGNPVQRVYSDDVGYMKELLIKDITIGDPINRRYNYSIGLHDPNAPMPNEHNDTGIERRYHSTIAGAMLSTSFKQHSAEVTAMLLAQADNGYINGPQQYNIANLESLLKSSNPGDILRSDAFTTQDWQRIIESINTDDEDYVFEKYFPDAAIANYRNVNGKRLKGLRLNATPEGEIYWQEIDRNDPTLTLDDQRNYIKHSLIPAVARKLLGAINRTVPPEVAAKQKTDSAASIKDLADSILRHAYENENEDLGWGERLNPNVDIFNAPDPNFTHNRIETERLKHKLDRGEQLTQREEKFLRSNLPPSTSTATPPSGSTPRGSHSGSGRNSASYATEDAMFKTRTGRPLTSGSASTGSAKSSSTSGYPIKRLDDDEGRLYANLDQQTFNNDDYEDYDESDYNHDSIYDDIEEGGGGAYDAHHIGIQAVDSALDQAIENGYIIDSAWVHEQVEKIFLENESGTDFEVIVNFLLDFFGNNQPLQDYYSGVSSIVSEVDYAFRTKDADQIYNTADVARTNEEKINTLRYRILQFIDQMP